MKGAGVLLCFSLVFGVYSDDNEVSFVLVDQDGEVITGGYEELGEIHEEYWQEIVSSPGFAALRLKGKKEVDALKIRFKNTNLEDEERKQMFVNHFWKQIEQEFALISMSLKIYNRVIKD